MKKSEVLEELGENVKSYYVFGSVRQLLAVYVDCLDWSNIKMLGEYIINIVASEKNDDLIRVTLDVEID